MIEPAKAKHKLSENETVVYKRSKWWTLTSACS